MKKVIKRIIGISTLLIGATLMMSFLSCKKDTTGSTAGEKEFDVQIVKIWGVSSLGKDKVSVQGDSKDKTILVKVEGCDNFHFVFETAEGVIHESDARGGEAEFDMSEDISKIKAEKETKLYIKLTAPGFRTFDKGFKVTRKDPPAPDIHVQIKRNEDSTPFDVGKGGEYETLSDTIEVTVLSKKAAVMKTVQIAGEDVAVGSDGKSAKKTGISSSTGNIEVVATFDNYKPFEFAFSIKKVTGKLKITPVKAIIYSGDDNESALKFDKDNKVEVTLDDIQYSCVKLVMEMDVELENGNKTKLVSCKDDRSENYYTGFKENDVLGIFSGKLKGEKNEKGEVTEYTSVSGKTLTEYLIACKGKVEYQFDFEATGRKKTSYTVIITNTNGKKVKYAAPKGDASGPHFFFSHGHGSAMFVQGAPVFSLNTYVKGPIARDLKQKEATKKYLEDMKSVEYMGGDVRMLFAKVNQPVPGDMYAYYRVSEEQKPTVPEFIRVKGANGKNPAYYFLDARIDPQEKYMDMFIAFKDYLPQALNPLHVNKKWNKILDKGFLFHPQNDIVIDKNKDNERSSTDEFYNAFTYRVQVATFSKNNTSAKELKIGYKQKYHDLLLGKEETAETFLDGVKDQFFMVPTFSGKMEDNIASFKYTIKKMNGETEEDITPSCCDVSLSPSKWTRFFLIGAKDENVGNDGYLVENKMNTIVTLPKGDSGNENIYKITVKVMPKNGSNSGTEETFTYIIDYKTEQSLDTLDKYSDEPVGDSDLFGVPTYYAEDCVVSKEITRMFNESLGLEYARKMLINR